jgi:hypothetical protein
LAGQDGLNEEIGIKKASATSPKSDHIKQVSGEKKVSFLSQMIESGEIGNICVKIISISSALKSRNGWQYRKLSVEDRSMRAGLLMSEVNFSKWDIQVNDYILANVRSNGIDNEGRLSFFFNDFVGPFDAAEMLFSLSSELYDNKTNSSERMKSSETVYQISAREAKSLLELIRLWTIDGKPQHYTKWCQMHQIVATNLYYMGLVKRTASMSGHYYPTTDALEFFEGKRGFPKKKVFIKDKEGRHQPTGEEGEEKTFTDYLSDYADRDSALAEYREALDAYRNRLKSNPELLDRANHA